MTREAQQARALLEKSIRLGEEGRLDEAIRGCEELDKRFGALAGDVMEEVCKALYYKGIWLGMRGRVREMRSVYDAQTDRTLGQHLVGEGIVLGRQGGFQNAKREYARTTLRFRQGLARVKVAYARYKQGVVFAVLERPADAAAAFDEVIRNNEDSDKPVLQEIVAQATEAKSTLD
jgi:hypothetical protein